MQMSRGHQINLVQASADLMLCLDSVALRYPCSNITGRHSRSNSDGVATIEPPDEDVKNLVHDSLLLIQRSRLSRGST